MEAGEEPTWELHDGVAVLAHMYKGLVLDQFGVLHNGTQALPGAVQAVAALHERGVRMVINSNSPQNEETTLARLERLGFSREYFVGAVTSGTLAAPALAAGEFGSTCLFFTWGDDDPRALRFVEQAALRPVATVAAADFIVAHGAQVMWTPGDAAGDVMELPGLHTTGCTAAADATLRQAVAKGLLMVCVNPDRVTVSPMGELTYVPGQLAARYVELGGRVQWYGKPYPDGFHIAVAKLGLPVASVAHVGDSLEHDVVGAAAVGLASVFVAAGVHGAELQCAVGTPVRQLSRHTLATVFARYRYGPTHVVSTFTW